jgi:hypothetical protein
LNRLPSRPPPTSKAPGRTSARRGQVRAWTSADRLFLELIDRAHARVILDGVFNHMGLRSFAFMEKRQRDSPYADWFTVTAFDPATPGTNEFA